MIFRRFYSLLIAFILILPCSSLSDAVFAQSVAKGVIIRGTVLSCRDSLPLAGAVAILADADGNMVNHGIADSDGRFSIEVSCGRLRRDDTLKITMLGYASVKIAGASLEKKGMTHGDGLIFMEEKPLAIREVIVSSPKVSLSGDTVVYDVAGFAESGDRSIGDVLKRMPGIDVSEEGKISYNGEEISNLYIEGDDILGGRYSLATNNLPRISVKSVEIMENHQHTRILRRRVPGEKPAINLKLQEHAKGTWIATSDMAGGISSETEALWDVESFLMRIGRKLKNISSLKSNNTGIDLRPEISVLSLDNMSALPEKEYFDSGIMFAPLDDSRVRFNKSFLFNTSNSIALGNDWSLKGSVAYSFDKLASEYNMETIYYTGNENIIIEESDCSDSQRDDLQIGVDVEGNREKFYFRNRTLIEPSWRRENTYIEGQHNYRSLADLPYFRAKNNLDIISGFSGNAFLEFRSDNEFKRTNQILNLRFTDNTQYESQANQEILSMSFETDNSANLKWSISDRLNLTGQVGMNCVHHSLESILEGLFPDNSLPLRSNENDTDFSRMKFYVSPSMRFLSDTWDISVRLPLNYLLYKELDRRMVLFSPFASVKFSPWQKLSLVLSGGISESDPDYHSFYEGYIMRSWKNLSYGFNGAYVKLNRNAAFSINYKDPLGLLFVKVYASRMWNDCDVSQSRNIAGGYVVTGLEYAPYRENITAAGIDGSMGIYGINGKIDAGLSYTITESSVFQDNYHIPFKIRSLSLSFGFKARPSRWLLLEYDFDYSGGKLFHDPIADVTNGSSGMDGSRNDYISHSLRLDFSPLKGFDITANGEHYYTTMGGNGVKNTFFADLSLEYTFKKGIRAYLTARNLFDAREYSWFVISDLYTQSSSFRIRPLNILAGISFNF